MIDVDYEDRYEINTLARVQRPFELRDDFKIGFPREKDNRGFVVMIHRLVRCNVCHGYKGLSDGRWPNHDENEARLGIDESPARARRHYSLGLIPRIF